MSDTPAPSQNASARFLVVRSYPELMTVVRERVAAIGAPIEVIEAHANMAHGHLGKILGLAENKRLGLFTLWPLVEALGLEILIAEHLDIAATRDEMGALYRPTAHYAKRGRLRKQISPALIASVARELGRRGGSMQKRFSMPAEKRSKIYRRNAKRRWRGSSLSRGK